MITTIDINNSFTEASRRRWRKMSKADLIAEMDKRTVNTTVSRYEVLCQRMRRVYFDVEKIPTDKPELINELITDLRKFYAKKLNFDDTQNINVVYTLNTGSKTHEGLSYHVIFPNICLDYTKQKLGVLEFVNSEEGSKYKEFIDASVYSSIRLFKLPYYIGIVDTGIDTNTDNYHRIIQGASSEFLISDVGDVPRFYPMFTVSDESLKVAKHFSGPFNKPVPRTGKGAVVQAVIPPTTPTSEATQKFTYKWCVEKLERINSEKSKLSPIIQKKVDELMKLFEEEEQVNKSLLVIYGNIIESIEKKL